MNGQRLCPVYKKWLQLNPSDARIHRLTMQAQAQKARQDGRLDLARELSYQTFEAAKIVLCTLQPLSADQAGVVREDILAFGSMGMYLSSILTEARRKHEAHTVLQECQQQLMAILPLHATRPYVCSVISITQQALEYFDLPKHAAHSASKTLH